MFTLTCDYCYGFLAFLGTLGDRNHFRCRSCGIECSMDVAAGDPSSMEYDSHPIAEEDEEEGFAEHEPVDLDDGLPEDEPDESMDGDHASALASAGFGTDEDYEHNLYDDPSPYEE